MKTSYFNMLNIFVQKIKKKHYSKGFGTTNMSTVNSLRDTAVFWWGLETVESGVGHKRMYIET